MIQRFQNWESKLRDYFASIAAEPFGWGKHDCCLFSASAIEAMTGVDLAADYRGKYRTGVGALRALKKRGFNTVEDVVTAALGEPKHIAHVKRGDVVFYQNAIGISCGRFSRFIGGLDESGHAVVSDGDEVAAGLIAVPTHLCDHAWTVPFHSVVSNG